MAEQRIGGRTPAVAVTLAVIALITVVIAVIVVASRGSTPARGTPPAVTDDRGPLVHRVAATVVVRLDRDTLEATTGANGVAGIKVTDAALRTELALGPTDVITAISGRSVKRQFDVHDALLGASTMNATALYVDLIREGRPALLRWDLDGDLRAARGSLRPRTGLFPSLPASPVQAVPDPLIDTIKKIDDYTYEVPRATFNTVLASPLAIAGGARVVPAMKQGQPNGFKIYAVRPRSVFAAIGLHNGDTIQSINGHALDSPSATLDLQDKLRGVDSLRIEIERRGRPEALEITVTR